MSTIAKLSGDDFDRMVQRGAFVDLEPMKIELIYGELRFMNPAGPVHEGEIEDLTDWSYANTNRREISIRVQSSINCGNHRPEPDLAWVRKMSSKRIRPTHKEVLLIIEVADSSAAQDLGEKAGLYAEHGIPEYRVVGIPAEQIQVHQAPHVGRYQSIRPFDKSTSISPLCQPSANLSLAELFDLDS
ncbi:MAG: Uma2 family endonuclease [Pirellulaceae bacterium]|nr:Uma2 family endonuclease [Planctomycetales bacterium]